MGDGAVPIGAGRVGWCATRRLANSPPSAGPHWQATRRSPPPTPAADAAASRNRVPNPTAVNRIGADREARREPGASRGRGHGPQRGRSGGGLRGRQRRATPPTAEKTERVVQIKKSFQHHETLREAGK